MKRIFVFAFMGIFLMSGICLAATLDPAKIVVPRDKGRIVESYMAKPDGSAPLIVYMQDIHINYEAQKAEAAVLEALIRDYGFDLVMIEAFDPNNPANLNEFKNGNKEAKKMAAEELLKKGTILGPEYLELTSDYNFTIRGAEDMALYKQETQDHAEIFNKAADMSKLIAILKNITSNLKLHVYSKEMQTLDDKIAAYDKDEIGLVEYVKYLKDASATNSIDMNALPNVKLFADSSALEGQIDFPAVEKERATAVTAIEKALTDKAKKDEFTAKGVQFRTGDITQGAYYTYLKEAADAAKVDLASSKNLNAYTSYITTFEKIDTTVLFKELKSLEETLQAKLATTPEQKKLAQIDKGFSTLSNMINTKLVPDEYNYFEQNKADFDLDGWLAFLKENSTKFALTNPVPDELNSLKTSIPLFEKFYAVSFDRDKAFIVNIKDGLAKLSKDKAVFVAGGFHTPHMKTLLKENGFSYVIIAPRVDVIKDYGDIYRERTKKDLEHLNKTIPAAQ